MFNNMKVFALMAGMTGLLGLLGSYFGGEVGLMTALIFAGAMNVAMYFWSSKLVLRMYRARVVTAAEEPKLYRMVDRLRQRAELPMPTIAIAGQQQANATGRNPANAVVCVTEGLKNLVNPLSGGAAKGFARWFMTHPRTADRVRALQHVATRMAAA